MKLARWSVRDHFALPLTAEQSFPTFTYVPNVQTLTVSHKSLDRVQTQLCFLFELKVVWSTGSPDVR